MDDLKSTPCRGSDCYKQPLLIMLEIFIDVNIAACLEDFGPMKSASLYSCASADSCSSLTLPREAGSCIKFDVASTCVTLSSGLHPCFQRQLHESAQCTMLDAPRADVWKAVVAVLGTASASLFRGLTTYHGSITIPKRCKKYAPTLLQANYVWYNARLSRIELRVNGKHSSKEELRRIPCTGE